jgi:Tfp pilus assembly protein PilF
MSVQLRVRGWLITLAAVFVVQSIGTQQTNLLRAAEQPLAPALNAWSQGDSGTAYSLLSELTRNGSRDPRAWYYQGVLAAQMGGGGDEEFRRAADLEQQTGNTASVNRALERIQGPIRARIEMFRSESRAAAGPNPGTALQSQVYRKGISQLRAGDLIAARETLSGAAVEKTSDPRIFYTLGLIQTRLGESDAARESFQRGLSLERTPYEIALVGEALEHFPGDVRRMIEEEVVVQNGNQRVTRRSNSLSVLRRSKNDQLIASERSLRGQGSDAEHPGEEPIPPEPASESAADASSESSPEPQQRPAQPITVDDPAVAANDAAETPADSLPAEAPEPKSLQSEPAGQDPPAEAPDDSSLPPAAAAPAAVADLDSSAASDPNGIDFSWLSPESELLIHVRPAEMLQSDFLTALMDAMPGSNPLSTSAPALGGIHPETVESFTFSAGDLMASILLPAISGGGGPGAAGAMQQFSGSKTAVAVIRLKSDLDLASLAASTNAEVREHAGKPYVLIPSAGLPAAADSSFENTPAPQPPVAMYSIDGRTILAGAEEGLKAALDRGPGEATSQQFHVNPENGEFLVVFSTPTLAAMSGALPSPQGVPPFVTELLNAVRGKLQGVVLRIQAADNLNVRIQLQLDSPEASGAAEVALKDAVQMLQEFYPGLKANVPEPLQPVTDFVVQSAEVENSAVEFSVNNETHQLSMTSLGFAVPSQLITVLKESPELLNSFNMGGPPAGEPASDPTVPENEAGFLESDEPASEFSTEPEPEMAEETNTPAETEPAAPSEGETAFGTDPAAPAEGDGEFGSEPAAPAEGDGSVASEPAATVEGDGEFGAEPAAPAEGDGSVGTEPAAPAEDDAEFGTEPAAPAEDDAEFGTEPEPEKTE